MGKRIIQQARGKGGPVYRVNKRVFKKKIGFPSIKSQGKIVSLVHSAAHSAPLMKVQYDKGTFFLPAPNGSCVGQEIFFTDNIKSESGNILALKDIDPTTKIFCIERNPGDGGKLIRSAGSSATVAKKLPFNKVSILMPNKKEIVLSGDCRAVIGIIAGDGRKLKPFIKAGNKYYKMKSRSKLWPRTSAVCMNAIDHPFGSGRGKRIKSKIAKSNAPAGRRVGHIRPKQTGKRK